MNPSSGEEVEDEQENNRPRSDSTDSQQSIPPDGGIKAILVVLASFINTGVVFSVITVNSLIISAIQTRLTEKNDSNPSLKACK